MHLGQRSYTSELADVRGQKDLGSIVSHDLKIMVDCNRAAAKVSRMLWALRRAFKRLDEGMFQVFYATYVRPHVEHCIQAVSPFFRKEAHILERLQMVRTKLVSGISLFPIDERMEHLHLFPFAYLILKG
ncbi:unnamed protein product, partial [Trichobilharzia szidati]